MSSTDGSASVQEQYIAENFREIRGERGFAHNADPRLQDKEKAELRDTAHLHANRKARAFCDRDALQNNDLKSAWAISFENAYNEGVAI